MAYGDLAFPHVGCPLPDVGNNLIQNTIQNEMINVRNTASTYIDIPLMFLFTDILLEERIGR